MARIYFLIGGNLGDREQTLRLAVDKMIEEIGEVCQTSAIYETEPWGFEHETSFLNQVVVLESGHSPFEVLEKLQKIEKRLGRLRREERYCERTIDIDILFYENQVVSSEHLKIPHPGIQERMFVLEPLREVAPELIHPVLKKSISELYDECKDSMGVRRYK